MGMYVTLKLHVKKVSVDYCTSIANVYDFLQDLLFSPAPHGLHYYIIGGARCQSNQCGAVGGASKTHLYGGRDS